MRAARRPRKTITTTPIKVTTTAYTNSALSLPAVPNASVKAWVIAVFHASAATTPKAALASEIMVATTSAEKRDVLVTTPPMMGDLDVDSVRSSASPRVWDPG